MHHYVKVFTDYVSDISGALTELRHLPKIEVFELNNIKSGNGKSVNHFSSGFSFIMRVIPFDCGFWFHDYIYITG